VTGLLEKEPRFLRPANYPEGTIGQGGNVFQLPEQPPIAVMNLQGTTFMPWLENPFRRAQAEVTRLRESTPIIILDFHAEATSEKQAMARLLDGQVSAVLGTHTHVQTADEQVFPGGTAFLCDAGMTGPHESILGREIEPVLQRFLCVTPQRFKVASGQLRLQGALIDIDEKTGRARSIERVSELLKEAKTSTQE
jgi:metallophosphoesterase (TIGR00282 family)